MAAAKAGVDSASPAGASAKAIEAGEVDAHFFDRKVYHTLVTRFRHGIYDNPAPGKAEANVSTAERVKVARKIAAHGAALLKNRGNVLPLDRAKFIAVIGADASADAVVMETGSPNVHVGTLSVPVDAIRARAGCEGACRVKVYDEARGAWMLFAGRYKLMVGASSRDIRLQRQWVVP